MTDPYVRPRPDPIDPADLEPARPLDEASLTAGWSASDVHDEDLVDDEWITGHVTLVEAGDSGGLGR